MVNKTYYTLLTSLPHIDSLFNNKITPISRLQLNRRISMLDSVDRDTLNQFEQIIHWSNLTETNEKLLIRKAEKLSQHLHNKATLKSLLNWRLDMRTIMATLRKKQLGLQAPRHSKWSYGSRYAFILRHWNYPYLGLQHAFPWIPKAVEFLQNNNHFSLEKLLLDAVWKKLDEYQRLHTNDFEAVVLYLMRWDLIYRWTSYNPDDAVKRFNQLTDQALNQFINLNLTMQEA